MPFHCNFFIEFDKYMLSFATEFPINDTINLDDFNRCVKKWLLGSRYTSFSAENLNGLGEGDAWENSNGSETISSLVDTTQDTESSAIVYRKKDSNFEWITTIVLACQPSSTWISIRVGCEPLHPTANVPDAKKPVLVKTLLDTLDGGVDGEFKVSAAPIIFTNSEHDLAVSCIQGETGSYLPVVYVSATFRSQYLVNPNELAIALYGMAHVVVEPDREFSVQIMSAVQRKNVYGGTIALYWPEGGGHRTFFAKSGNDSPDDIKNTIFDEIRLSLINRRPLTRCTLSAVKELKSKRLIRTLKDVGSAEVTRYVDAFEDELKSKDFDLENSEKEILRLKAEIRKLEAQIEPISGFTLCLGNENAFYEGEILNLVCDVLSKAIETVPKDSRRQHLLKAMVNANSISIEGDRIRSKVKELLRGYQSMDQKTRRGLEEIGFFITEDGRHYKITYQNDSRYTFSLSKSGSDNRGGLNAASDICNLFF
jgi:hypothetical protein